MNPIRWIGHLLLWCGFLAGAFLAVCNAEIAGDKWSTVDWHFYALALFVGAAGVVVLRASQHQEATHSDKLSSGIDTLEQRVQSLILKLGKLLARSPVINVYEVRHFIDDQLARDLGDFVEARQALVHTYSLQQYADLMTDFAVAERNINRAWSASADGYVEEVWLSLQRADEKLAAVARRLKDFRSERFGDAVRPEDEQQSDLQSEGR